MDKGMSLDPLQVVRTDPFVCTRVQYKYSYLYLSLFYSEIRNSSKVSQLWRCFLLGQVTSKGPTTIQYKYDTTLGKDLKLTY